MLDELNKLEKVRIDDFQIFSLLRDLFLNNEHPKKSKLNLASSHLTANSLEEILSYLKIHIHDNREIELNLSSNHIGNEGAKILADALQANQIPNNVIFNLRYNNIDTIGANYIIDAIKNTSPFGLKIYLQDHNSQNLGRDVAKILTGNNIENPIIPNDIHDEQAKIDSLITHNDLKKATEVCFIIQQGSKQHQSHFYGLPIELLLKIYDLSFSFINYKNKENLQKIFSKKLSYLFTTFKLNNKEAESELINAKHFQKL